jgi:hypothetical protein
MEHNIEKNIRLKAHEAEQYPVRWGKEELWARMEIHRTSRSKRPVYFAIAASLAVAILAGVYSYQRITDIPHNTKATGRTESPQLVAADLLRPESKAIPPSVEATAPRNAITQTNARIRIEEEPYIYTSAITETASDTTISDARDEMSTPSTIPANTEAAPENAVKHPKVIIGIIPVQEQQLVTQQEKKKKFRLLKGKSEHGDSEGNQLIIARIN